MDKQSTSLSPDWVRCKSKSRKDRHYMFNKKTGETTWCSETVNNSPIKTVSAKDVVKTPAQDRLKRLQRDIQKKKLTESVTDKKKGGRLVKKVEPSQIMKPKTSGSNGGKEASSKVTTFAKTPSLTVDKAINVESSPSDTTKPMLTRSGNQSPKLFQNIAPKNPDSKPNKTDTNTAQKAKHKEDYKFVIPKKIVRGLEGKSGSSSGIKENSSKTVERTAEPSKISPESRDTDHGQGMQCISETRPSERTSTPLRNETSLIESTEKSITTVDRLSTNDINDNEDQSQSTFVSKLKNFCNKLIGKTTKPYKRKLVEKDKEKQTNLSINSKPFFKQKKNENKSILLGVLHENEAGRIPKQLSDLPHKHPLSSIKASSPIPVPTESANGRLQRLRQSLQLQQKTTLNLNASVSPSSSTLDLLSEDSHISSSVCISSVNTSECEPMDWESVSDESAQNEISSTSPSNVHSADSSTVSEHYGTVNENLLRLAADKKHNKQWKTDHFYFIVDTNVFIQNLTFVEELTTMKLCDTVGTLIYVPYCVLQELDKLKIRSPSESIKTRSARAIKYLNKSFENKNQQILAQTAADETNHLIKVTSPDDSILNCCLQVKKHIDNVLLLTEDINLQNKAMCNDILVSTKSDLISKHESLI